MFKSNENKKEKYTKIEQQPVCQKFLISVTHHIYLTQAKPLRSYSCKRFSFYRGVSCHANVPPWIKDVVPVSSKDYRKYKASGTVQSLLFSVGGQCLLGRGQSFTDFSFFSSPLLLFHLCLLCPSSLPRPTLWHNSHLGLVISYELNLVRFSFMLTARPSNATNKIILYYFEVICFLSQFEMNQKPFNSTKRINFH